MNSNIEQDISNQLVNENNEDTNTISSGNEINQIVKNSESNWQTLARELLEIKLEYLTEVEKKDQEIKQLHSQVKWILVLIGLGVILLTGSAAWLFYRLDLSNYQVNYLKQEEEITILKNEIQSIKNKIPDNIESIENNYQKLNTIEQKIINLEERQVYLEKNSQKKEQTMTILIEALQKLIDAEKNNNLDQDSNSQ